jgi:uncharacterized protein (TIGR00162 family)
MSTWKIEEFGRIPKLKNPIMIEGLPGIANVGKIAVDFMIGKMRCKRAYRFSSHKFPHSVFVNDKNLVELPVIELWYSQHKNNDLLFLVGDIQPIDETSCYEFCELTLDKIKGLGCNEIITLGGIGLSEIPKQPKVYCTATNKDIIKRYKDSKNMDERLYGIVGPIIGVTGLLVGLAPQRKIEGIAILAETYGHPMYLGVNGAREIVKILNKKFKLKLDLSKLDKEVEQIDEEVLKRTEELSNVNKDTMKKLPGKKHETSYIG